MSLGGSVEQMVGQLGNKKARSRLGAFGRGLGGRDDLLNKASGRVLVDPRLRTLYDASGTIDSTLRSRSRLNTERAASRGIMNALFIADKDSKTELSGALAASIVSSLRLAGVEVEMVEVASNDAAPCLGCLLCVTKHPGECVCKDLVNDLKKRVHQYAMTVFMTPVVFGHYSSTIKNALDRIGGSHEL